MKETKQSRKTSLTVAKTPQFAEENLPSSSDPTLMLAQINRKMLELLAAPELPAGLYLIATPIGNLSDITLRALATLFRVKIIYCEDTRHSRKLLTHYSIRKPLNSYHDHNARMEGPKMLNRIENGESIALISDAGTPLISDPGYHLVKMAHEKNILVTALPGPSAVVTALCTAGLPTDIFTFAGFLPSKSKARLAKLDSFKAISSTLVFYESPKRIHKTLSDMEAIYQNRFCVLARELTKRYESLYQGRLSQLIQRIDDIPSKGEYVILLAPLPQDEADLTDEQILEKLQNQRQTKSLRDSVQSIATEFNISKKRVYKLGLTLKS